MKSFLDRFRRKGSHEPAGKKLETGRDIAREAARSAPGPDREGSGKPPEPHQAGPIFLYLEDFLPRIPPELLASDIPDPRAPIAFDVDDIAQRIVEGYTTIAVSEIQKRAPLLFIGEIAGKDDVPLRFPWQKLLDMVRRVRTSNPLPGITEEIADSLASKIRNRKRKPAQNAVAMRPQVPALSGSSLHSGTQPAWFTRPVAPRPVVAVAENGESAAPPTEESPVSEPRPEFSPVEEEAIAGAINRICEAADAEVNRAIEEHRETLTNLERERDDSRAEVMRLTDALAAMTQERDALAAEKQELERKLAGNSTAAGHPS
jgi:hypothetical protein